ncbi:MAG: M20/M25/M40 family metallo-hydrolase [Synergistaceae bacterium]|jgi:acetylornithine deacetylase/succinyl-diaminopimelate desuccinylase-like protein|nr:M20/M25/M40 family metallo-hydrolase [Synergistaceae bacterium]
MVDLKGEWPRKCQKAFDYVDDHFDEMLEDLREVCAFPSTAGNPEGLEGTRRCLISKMKRVGLEPTVHEVEGGNAIITADTGGEGEAALLFYNHYDVVEPGKYENWRIPNPFDLRAIEGKLYGRGVSDNKGPLYSRLHAVQATLAAEGRLPVRVKFLAEGDEETSSPSLHRFARENAEAFREMTRADVCIWESGRNDDAGRMWLRLGVRGGMAFDLSVRTSDTDVHGRMGAIVPSASWRLVWALASLKTPDEKIAIEGFYDEARPPSEADLEVLRAFPYDEESLKKKVGFKDYLRNASGDELKRRICMEPSISICGLESGEVHDGVRGIVPHKAYARVSFYLVPDQDPAKLETRLRRHLDAHGFSDVEVKTHGGFNRPVRTPVDTPFRHRANQAAEAVFGKPLVVELTQLGAGPADVFRDAWPTMPIAGIGPSHPGGNHHSPDENLRVEDYRKAVKYLIALFYSYQ